MQPTYVSKSITALSSNGIGAIAAGQSTAVTLNSSQLDTGRRIALVSNAGADISTAFFTITGTREGGGIIRETLVGSTGTTTRQTTQDFLTVTSITASSVLGSSALFGTSSIGGTPWQMVNWQISPIELGGGIAFSTGAASVTASIEHTFDDPTGTYPNRFSGANGSTQSANIGVPSVYVSTSLQNLNPSNVLWSPFPSDSFAPFTPCAAWRLTIVSSGGGTITATVVQSGVG